MSARTRLYTVRDRKTGAGRLVRAPSAATAVRIMADALYSVDVASQDECVDLAPPAAPEPSEAEVAAAMASLHRAMEPAAWPSEDEITDALRAAAAARGK